MYWFKYKISLKRKNKQETIACKVWYLWCCLWQDSWWNKSHMNNNGHGWWCLYSNDVYILMVHVLPYGSYVNRKNMYVLICVWMYLYICKIATLSCLYLVKYILFLLLNNNSIHTYIIHTYICINYRTGPSTISPIFSKFLIFCWLTSRAFRRVK